jgi:hypothetical protein
MMDASESFTFSGSGEIGGLGLMVSVSRTDFLSSVKASEITLFDLGGNELISFLEEMRVL